MAETCAEWEVDSPEAMALILHLHEQTCKGLFMLIFHFEKQHLRFYSKLYIQILAWSILVPWAHAQITASWLQVSHFPRMSQRHCGPYREDVRLILSLKWRFYVPQLFLFVLSKPRRFPDLSWNVKIVFLWLLEVSGWETCLLSSFFLYVLDFIF